MRQQADIMELKIARQATDKRARALASDLEATRTRLSDVQGSRSEVLKELEVVRRERNFMSESLRELQMMLLSRMSA